MKQYALVRLAIVGMLMATGCSLLKTDQPSSNQTLLKVGDQNVTVDEFKYVYEKNNKKSDSLYTLKDLKAYADLYTNFKLKVQAAKDAGLDTLPKLKRELRTYKDQLAEPYLRSDSMMEVLLQEAYNRYKQQIRAKHISIRVPRGAPAKDTANARSLLATIRSKALSGKSFQQLAQKYSKEVSAGDLGYFSVFDQPYAIENTAYQLAKGDISKPLRTDFGYHLIKVTAKKPYRGKMKARHIMVKPGQKSEAQGGTTQSAQARIDSIYQLLQEGSEFSNVARMYSEDRRSSRQGGELPSFDRTNPNFPDRFKEKAFSLNEDGAMTKPFRTRYGFHILKRVGMEKPDSFGAIRPELKQQLKQSDRYALVKQAVADRVKRENNFKQYPINWEPLKSQLDSTFKTGGWTVKSAEPLRTKLFRIGDTTYQLLDYARYLEAADGQKLGQYQYHDYALKALYDKYRRKKILAYERQNLKANHPEYRHLMKEYKEGVLLFEIMDRKVWKKAVNDSAGLRAYFSNHREAYQLPAAKVVTYYRFSNPKGQKQAYQQVKAGEAHDVVKQNLRNTLQSTNWVQAKDTLTQNQQAFIRKVKDEPGVYRFAFKGQYYVVDVAQVLPAKQAPFEAVRGQVVADYQKHLEKEWLDTLRERYTIKLHEDVLESLADSA